MSEPQDTLWLLREVAGDLDADTSLHHILAAAAAEIERLEAIVDKLARDADGLTVLPGQTLYAPRSGLIVGPCPYYVLYPGGDPSGWPVLNPYKIRDCHSTKAAALAARGPPARTGEQ